MTLPFPGPFSTPPEHEDRTLEPDPGQLPATLLRAPDHSAFVTPETVPPIPGPGAGAGASRLLAPELVPGYEILQELGRGGMGVVYKARQIGLNRIVALKMILAGAQAGIDDHVRFRTEARAIASLQHPNIVQVHDIGELNGQPFFSLEFCAGGSLGHHLDGTPLPARLAATLLVPLARAVACAHAAGLIHRDLKPGNILLQTVPRRDDREETREAQYRFEIPAGAFVPKIADFGLAKHLGNDSQTRSGDVLGTPNYMAPEQASGKVHDLGPAVDVYALGAILYECLTGRPPFCGSSPMETALEVVFRDPVSVRALQPRVPRDLETICMKCLRKEPARRYASANDLADDLERFLDGRSILARPTGFLENAWRWMRRRPAQAALVVVLLLAFLGGVVGWISFTAQLKQERYLARLERDEARHQRSVAERRQREAEANAELARKNFDLAEKRFLEALQVVDLYFTSVSESTLLHEPGVQQLRQTLLRNARVFYTNFVEQRRNDSRLAAELARSLHRLAIVDGELGDLTGAVTQLTDAVRRFDLLLSDHSEDHTLLLARSRALNDLGRLERLRDRPDQATAAFRTALQSWNRLVKMRPDLLEARGGLARCHLGLGNVALLQRRLEEARDEYRRALDLRQELVRAEPGNEIYQRDLAVTWQNLASVLHDMGEKREEAAAHAAALAVFRQLVKVQPSRAIYRNDLAMACYNEGTRRLQAGHLDQAAESYQEAVRDYELLSFTHPAMPIFSYRLSNTLWNLGLVQEKRGRSAEAMKLYARVRDVRQKLADAHPGIVEYLAAFAQSVRADGDRLLAGASPLGALDSYRRAEQLLEKALAQAPSRSEYRALLAEVVHQTGLVHLRTRRKDEAEAAFRRTLALLEEVKKNGTRPENLALEGTCCNNLGLLARQGNAPEQARTWYDRALQQAKLLQRLKQLPTAATKIEADARKGLLGRSKEGG